MNDKKAEMLAWKIVAVGLLLLLAMSLASCSKDEIPEPPQAASWIEIEDISKDGVPPFYQPWVPDTTDVSQLRLTVREWFPPVYGDDTVTILRITNRVEWFQARGFPFYIYSGMDTTMVIHQSDASYFEYDWKPVWPQAD